jgi:hypothetical protein
VGLAGNGVGVLNGQTTKQDSVVLVEELFTVNAAREAGDKFKELHHQVDLGHVCKVFREQIRGFHDLLRQKPPPLLIL